MKGGQENLGQNSQQRQCQVPMYARLQLYLDINVQLYPQLQPILVHHVRLPALRVHSLGRFERLRWAGAPHGDLAAHGAGVGHGAVHRLGRGLDPLEGLHFGYVVDVWVLELRLRGLFFLFLDTGHGLSRGVASLGGGLRFHALVLAAPTAGLRA